MNEQNHARGRGFPAWLVALLVVAVAVQGVLLYRLYHNPATPAQTRTLSGPALASTAQAAPATPARRKQGSTGAPGSVFGLDPNDLWWDPDMNTWDPFLEFRRMREQMQNLFDDSFSRFQLSPGFTDQWADLSFSPSMDLKEEGDNYVVRMNIPGAEKSDISVRIDDRLLTVSGRVDETVEKKGARFLRKERRSGRFERAITLPGPVQADKMTARYQDGVLSVTVPKGRETASSKTIKIQ